MSELAVTLLRLGMLVGGLAMLPAHAHHSWARYDGDHVVTVKATITAIEWTNPHVIMRMTIMDESGQPAEWMMEMDPPTLLNRYGLRHDTITVGMEVEITGVRARSGAPMMRAVMIELPDGTRQRVSSRV
jgi:DNA/RNA endonuclease YhcR with UshA esterase domain